MLLVAANGNSSRSVPQPLTASSGKPQRIVSMSPANTEILFALGAGDRVVGVTSYSDYPDEAKSIASIGAYSDPDVEKIVGLAPDLVLAMGEIQAKQVHLLQQAGLHVVVVEAETLPEILTAIDTISVAVGEEKAGSQLHAKLAGILEHVQQRVADASPKRVFIEVWDSPLLTVGGKSFINDMISQAGGVNVAAGRDVDYTPCDLETIYAYDPAIYVVISHSRNNIHSLITRPECNDLKAVKDKQVYQIVDDLVGRPGPRCFNGLVELAKIIHPELMENWQKE
jgi:iron complex transport system substrate-binding protein